jgi:hypothetical protein
MASVLGDLSSRFRDYLEALKFAAEGKTIGAYRNCVANFDKLLLAETRQERDVLGRFVDHAAGQ